MRNGKFRLSARLSALFGAVLAAVLFAAPAMAADAELMKLVMPDVRAVAGVNVTAVVESPLGKFLLAKAAGAGAGQNGQSFTAMTGFNPVRDLSEVLLATSADAAEPTALVLVKGKFDKEKIAATLGARPGMTVSTYEGSTLISGVAPGQKEEQGMAFLGGTVAVMGHLALVKAALDRSTGSTAIDPALAEQVSRRSAAADVWFVSTVMPQVAGAGGAGKATGAAQAALPFLQGIRSSSGGMRLGSNVQLDLEVTAADVQNAVALSAYIGMAKAIGTSNKQVASALPFLQDMQSEVHGNALKVALSIPESQVETLAGRMGEYASSFRKGLEDSLRRQFPTPDGQPERK